MLRVTSRGRHRPQQIHPGGQARKLYNTIYSSSSSSSLSEAKMSFSLNSALVISFDTFRAGGTHAADFILFAALPLRGGGERLGIFSTLSENDTSLFNSFSLALSTSMSSFVGLSAFAPFPPFVPLSCAPSSPSSAGAFQFFSLPGLYFALRSCRQLQALSIPAANLDTPGPALNQLRRAPNTRTQARRML